MNNRKMNKCFQIQFEFNANAFENLWLVIFLFFFLSLKEAATLMEGASESQTHSVLLSSEIFRQVT